MELVGSRRESGVTPSPPNSSGPAGERRALTDWHVVAAVREASVPVTELGLVAAAGTLGLAGHWVGHGCGGRGRGSAGSLTARTAAAPPSAGQSGRGHQAAH